MYTIDQKNESTASSSDFGTTISEALFPRIRGRVLALFMQNPDKRFYFREAVRIIGDSPASIQRELKSLTAAGILRMEPIGIQTFYSANGNSPVYEELRSIVRKTFGVPDALKAVLKLHIDKIQFAWINGPVSTDREDSGGEIDLTMIGTFWVGDLAALLEPVEKSLGRSIAPSLYTREDFAKKCRVETDFQKAVSKSTKLFLVGDPDELDKSMQLQQ